MLIKKHPLIAELISESFLGYWSPSAIVYCCCGQHSIDAVKELCTQQYLFFIGMVMIQQWLFAINFSSIKILREKIVPLDQNEIRHLHSLGSEQAYLICI